MPPINITHDGTFDIALSALSNGQHSLSWKNKEMLWSEFVERTSVTQRTFETYKEYCAFDATRQGEIKNVGSYVGGYLSGGKRGKNSILHRQIVTLDIDQGTPGIWSNFEMLYDNAAVMYATHKHTKEKPRLRVILPLNREVSPGEYEAIARRIGGNLGIEVFDNTGFQPSRLMYWPSTSKDGDYEWHYQDGPWWDADKILSSYVNWRDASEWPVSLRYKNVIDRNIKKQGDPLEKDGLVGTFCRAYTIEEVIETLLSDVYDPCDVEDRYTYKEGSTAAGLVTYESKYAYSHHGTDPCSMKLCNAFDLVRIHKFGNLDTEESEAAPSHKRPSFLKMVEFCTKDARVRTLIGVERLASAQADFNDGFTDDQAEVGLRPETSESVGTYEEVQVINNKKKSKPEPEPENTEWIGTLDMDKKGNYYSTIDNIIIILNNDPRLKTRFCFNVFDMREEVCDNLPWRKLTPFTKALTDRDLSCLKHYIEKHYSFQVGAKIEDALNIIFEHHQRHPVKEYLGALKWDGIRRVDTLLIDYLGAADTAYTRAITRKMLCAAISRIYEPGCKFDYMVTLIGGQGKKKSMLADKLGGKWFSDTFTTVQGKEAYEQLQGSWVIEVAELSALKKSEVEAVKHFIVKRIDKYRVAYGRRVEEFARQCIFIGTSNDLAPLKDKTGNRRFWPVAIYVTKPVNDVSSLTPSIVAQLWAEALEYWREDEPLYLSPELEKIAESIQAEHTESDEREGAIGRYLEALLPETWSAMFPYERFRWLQSDELLQEGTVPREYVCASEIFCECFGGKPTEVSSYVVRDIHNIMRDMQEWKYEAVQRNFGIYGRVRGYARVDIPKTLKSCSVGSEFNEE